MKLDYYNPKNKETGRDLDWGHIVTVTELQQSWVLNPGNLRGDSGVQVLEPDDLG